MGQAIDLHPDVLHQQIQVAHIENVGNIGYAHNIVSKQRGTNHLQGFVLGTLRLDGSTERMSSFNDE